MNNSQFLSDFNINNIYNTINSYINQNINYNLDYNTKYRNTLIPTLAKQVYNKHNTTKNIEELNKITIDASKTHVLNLVKKKTNTNTDYKSSPLSKLNVSNKKPSLNYHDSLDSINSFSRSNYTYLDIESEAVTSNVFPNETYTNLDDSSAFNNYNTIEKNKDIESNRNPQNKELNNLEDNLIKESISKINFKKSSHFDYKTDPETDSETDSDSDFFKRLDKNIHKEYKKNTKNTSYSNFEKKEDDKKKYNNTKNIEGDKPKEIITYIEDHGDDNLIKEYDPKINISEFAKNQQIDVFSKSSKNQLNTSSKLSSVEKEHNIIILDIPPPGGDHKIKDIICTLNSDLIITGLCDIYLEFISLHGLSGSIVTRNIEFFNTFLLRLDGLSTPTISNNNNIIDKFTIPNETYGINDNVADTDGVTDSGSGSNLTSMVVRLKSNYVCTIQPKTIKTIRVTLEGLTRDNNKDKLEVLTCQGSGRLQIGLLFKNR